MKIPSKLPDVGSSIFTIMSKMAIEHQAINLSQGFPDFPVNEKLVSLINDKMKAGKNQYAPLAGIPDLQEAIGHMISRRHGFEPDVHNTITITTGATEALFSIFQGLIEQGDEVIILDPAYDHYHPAVRLSGGIPVHVPLNQPNFSIDWERIEENISKKTRAIIINTPHNPSGTVISAEDISRLEKVSEEYDLLVISDEVYEWIIFDEFSHQSILTSEILRERGVAVYSFGKTFHATGWKIGYAVAGEKLTKEIRKTHQFITFCVNTPIQYALAEHVREPENYEYLPKFFQQKRDFFNNLIKNSGFEIVPCHGTYFELLSYKNIFDKPDIEMAEWLTKERKVASIPISPFYADNEDNRVLRFCFGKNEETLKQAAEILCKI